MSGVTALTPLELHEAILEHGGALERHGNKHRVYKGPHGSFTVPHGKRKPITYSIVRSAAKALGTTSKHLLGT